MEISENQKLRLRLMKKKYELEILSGNRRNVNNLIATTIILDQAFFNWGSLEQTLKEYIYYNESQKSDEYLVPTLDQLNNLKKKYKRQKRILQCCGNDNKSTAIKWMSLMLKYDLIQEAETINVNDIRLADFITDKKIIDMYKKSVMTLDNPNPILVKKHN